MHLHVPLLRGHPGLQVAAQIVDALHQGHAFEDRGLLGGVSLEICVERCRELGQPRLHRLLQLGEVGLAGGERRRPIGQERGALAGKNAGQAIVAGGGRDVDEAGIGNLGAGDFGL